MKKWYATLVREIKGLGDRVFFDDPDNLMRDLNLRTELLGQFRVHEYKNDASLYLFIGKHAQEKIVVHSTNPPQREYVQKSFKKVHYDLHSLFPELDAQYLQTLDVSYLQRLFAEYEARKKQGLGFGSTEEFVLKSIWDIDLIRLDSPTENLHIALTYIIDEKDIPDSIKKKVSKRLGIDLDDLRTDPKALQSWARSLIKAYSASRSKEQPAEYDLSKSSIQYYLLRLNMLRNLAIPLKEDMLLKERWLTSFKENPDDADDSIRALEILKTYRKEKNALLSKEFDFNDVRRFMSLARMFCEILYLVRGKEETIENLDLYQEYTDFDKLFRTRLISCQNNNYEALFHASTSDTPLTLDKVLDFMIHTIREPKVLLVMDGMSFDEWQILKKELQGNEINEREIFAIIPTVTAFSRTAIFSGRTPNEFMNEKYQANEEKEFYQAMSRFGMSRDNCLYGHINLRKQCISSKEDVPFGRLKGYDFIGLVCNIFDDISHEKIITKSFKENMYKRIKAELPSSGIKELIRKLRDEGYVVVLTADHGNIFCEGNGIKKNKNLEILKESSRCLFYENEDFAESLTLANPDQVFIYRYRYLPSKLLLALPVRNRAFIREEDYAITHGGISPEELIVPLVIIT